jgi:hypothetical protein
MSELNPSRFRYPALSLQSAEVAGPKNESKSTCYENRTKFPQSGGLERNGPRERISGSDRVSGCGGFRATPAFIGVSMALKTGRRKFLTE